MALPTGFKETLLNTGVTAIANAVTYLGLGDETGTELSGGTPAYARKAVTWTVADDGATQPNADLTFDIPSGATVKCVLLFAAATGGSDLGGKVVDEESYTNQGTYTLKAAQSSMAIANPS